MFQAQKNFYEHERYHMIKEKIVISSKEIIRAGKRCFEHWTDVMSTKDMLGTLNISYLN